VPTLVLFFVFQRQVVESIKRGYDPCSAPTAGFVRLDHEQVLERTREAIRDGRGHPPKVCSRARARCSPTMRAIRNSAGSSTRCSLRNSRALRRGLYRFF
jgi:hypothetical protein